MKRFDFQSICIQEQRKTVIDGYQRYLRKIDAAQTLEGETRKEAIDFARQEFLVLESNSCLKYKEKMKEFDSIGQPE